MICIYHNRDLDGFSSAAIVNKYCIENNIPCEFIGFDYGRKVPDVLTDPNTNDDVVIVDLSFDFNVMLNLAKQIAPKKLIWIDHHISAIKEFEKSELSKNEPDNFDTNILVGIGACELAWQYFFPDKSMPLTINYLGIYDTFRGKDKPEWKTIILPFQLGMQSMCKSYDTFPESLLTDVVDESVKRYIKYLTENGNAIQGYKNSQNELLCELFSFETIFMGKRAIVMNNSEFSSRIFDSVWDPAKYDIMICFAFTGTGWKVSLYSEKSDVDCSAMAKQHGGGGHVGAAGFTQKELPDFIWATKNKPINSL